MKIVADENIPQVAEAFDSLGQAELLPGKAIKQQDLRDCQCLLVRTVTRVDRNLLDGTAVEFVGSATIGTDHVDLDYLKKNNIGFSNAAGCNAEAASEYVISGLFALAQRKGFDPFKLKAGIVGCGNVGSRLAHKLEILGIEILRNDPPRAASVDLEKTDPGIEYLDLDTLIAECNFISLHVPLTRTGKHPTQHLFDHQKLQKLRKNCLLVNAARGAVIDNKALLEVLQSRNDLCLFLDTWEHEPDLSRALLDAVDLATPHIAGYSVEGRLRGTQMILDAACQHFSLSANWNMTGYLPELTPLQAISASTDRDFWQQLFKQHHDIWVDHQALTDSKQMNDSEFVRHFESLRRVYEQRREYERFVLPPGIQKKAAAIARELLFQ